MSGEFDAPEVTEIKFTDKRRAIVDDPTPLDETADVLDEDEDEDELDVEVEEEVDPVTAALAEAAQHRDDLQRLKAEFDNFRKRVAREQVLIGQRAAQSLVERILPVLDNFELAMIAADRTQDYEGLVRGVELVYGELRDLMGKEGLERIEALHKPFDPELHEAVMRTGDGDELIVLEEMRTGYTMDGRVIRPSMVKVGPPPGDDADQEEDESQ